MRLKEPLINPSADVTGLSARRPQDRRRRQTGGLSRRRADGLRADRPAQTIDFKRLGDAQKTRSNSSGACPDHQSALRPAQAAANLLVIMTSALGLIRGSLSAIATWHARPTRYAATSRSPSA